MNYTDNKEDFFRQLKEVFYPGDMLYPISSLMVDVDWLFYEFCDDWKSISNEEVRERLLKWFEPFKFEGVECVRTFIHDIPSVNNEQSKNQLGILIPPCSFEASVILRWLEYNERCQDFYQKNDDKVYLIRYMSDYPVYEQLSNYPAPDLLAVQEWLREKHQIIVESKSHLSIGSDAKLLSCTFSYVIKYMGANGLIIKQSDDKYPTAYYALHAGIVSILYELAEKTKQCYTIKKKK